VIGVVQGRDRKPTGTPARTAFSLVHPNGHAPAPAGLRAGTAPSRSSRKPRRRASFVGFGRTRPAEPRNWAAVGTALFSSRIRDTGRASRFSARRFATKMGTCTPRWLRVVDQRAERSRRGVGRLAGRPAWPCRGFSSAAKSTWGGARPAWGLGPGAGRMQRHGFRNGNGACAPRTGEPAVRADDREVPVVSNRIVDPWTVTRRPRGSSSSTASAPAAGGRQRATLSRCRRWRKLHVSECLVEGRASNALQVTGGGRL